MSYLHSQIDRMVGRGQQEQGGLKGEYFVKIPMPMHAGIRQEMGQRHIVVSAKFPKGGGGLQRNMPGPMRFPQHIAQMANHSAKHPSRASGGMYFLGHLSRLDVSLQLPNAVAQTVAISITMCLFILILIFVIILAFGWAFSPARLCSA